MRILNNTVNNKDACYGNCFRNYFCVPKMFIMPIKYLNLSAHNKQIQFDTDVSRRACLLAFNKCKANR